MATDGGYSIGQVMKFAAHKNSKTLVNDYLSGTVDGGAAFLKCKRRKDIAEDFRSASMGGGRNLPSSLTANNRHHLKQRQDYIDLSERIIDLKGEGSRTQRRHLYDQRQTLVDEELEKQRRNPQSAITDYEGEQEGEQEGEWKRTYFDRVVRHMVPERDRLAKTLFLAVPLRSQEGISALRDLIALRTNDCTVAYQEGLRPLSGRCPVPTCGEELKK
jgi:hypothetical protein